MDLFSISKRKKSAKFNQTIVDGLAYHQLGVNGPSAGMSNAMSYVNNEIRCIMDKCAPPGLDYLGISRTPAKVEIARSVISSKRLKYDRNNLYMVTLKFAYNGKKLKPMHLRLPHVERGGELVMNGKSFFISPVLSDRGVNLKDNGMYVFMNRGNINFKRQGHNFLEDNFLVMENFVGATMLQENRVNAKKKRDKGLGKINVTDPSVFIYLLLDRGATDAIKHYFGLDAIFETGTYEELRHKYPQSDYVIYSSGGKKPKGVNAAMWETPTLSLIFKTPTVGKEREVAANFFNIYDHFTTRIYPEMLEDIESWKVIAGHLIFNHPVGDAKLAELVDRHLDKSLHHLIDNSTLQELHLDNIMVNDIYELLAWFTINEKEVFINKNPADMGGKRLNILRYTLGAISANITRLSYALMDMHENVPNHAKMEKTIERWIREGVLKGITGKNGEVNSMQVSVDNMWLGVTRKIIPQAKNAKKSNKDRGKMYKSENFIHTSIFLNGQIDGHHGPLH